MIIEDRLVATIEEQMDGHQAVLVSDYAKALCSPRLMTAVVRRAADCGIPVLADPARIPCYDRYRGVTVLTPNRVEAELATGCSITDVPSAFAAGRSLLCDLDLDAVLLTLDKDGIAVITKNDHPRMVPTREREVYDITGAGDMVLAVAGLCQASGLSCSEAASLANVAAGLQVERLGVTPITRAEMLAELAEEVARAAGENTPVGRASSLPFAAGSQAGSLPEGVSTTPKTCHKPINIKGLRHFQNRTRKSLKPKPYPFGVAMVGKEISAARQNSQPGGGRSWAILIDVYGAVGVVLTDTGFVW